MKITDDEFLELLSIERDLLSMCNNFKLTNTEFYRKDIDKIFDITSRIIWGDFVLEINTQDVQNLIDLEASLLSLNIIDKLFKTDFKDSVVNLHNLIETFAVRDLKEQ